MRPPGAAFALAALVAVAIAILEAVLPNPGVRRTAGDFLYGIDVHLLLAIVAVGLARLVTLRRTPAAFFTLALAFQLAIEGGLTAGFWFGKGAAFLAPPGTRPGMTEVAAFGAACGMAGLGLGFALGRWGLSRLMVRWSGGVLGRAGALAGALLLAANVIALAVARPRPETFTVRPGADAQPRPDVVLILVDTLRRDHLSRWGYPRPTSPNLDRFFDECIVCTNVYTPSNWTLPSVASLFTGRYPSNHRVIKPSDVLPEALPTLAEHFRSYGYLTGGFIGNNLIMDCNGFLQGFGHHYPGELPYWFRNLHTAGERLLRRYLQHTDVAERAGSIVQATLRWLRSTPGRPHFAYLHIMDPHSPYTPPRGARNRVAPGIPGGPIDPPLWSEFGKQAERAGCHDWGCLENPPTLSDSALAGMVANYDGEIRAVDEAFGVLMAGLAELGYLDGCHIIFCTDHGEEFGDHRGWFHGASIYEEMIACPLAYRPPGGVKGGRIVARPIPLIDIIPTLCARIGIEPLPLDQGSEIPEVTGAASPEYALPVLSEAPPCLYALRLRGWKLVRRGPKTSPDYQLFDLDRDPLERTDLAAQWPDTLAMLRGYLDDLTVTFGRRSEKEIPAAENPELLRRLRDLGYID